MWTFGVLLLGLLAGASAQAWKPNNEYQYNVLTKTVTSLEGLNHTSTGVFVRTKLVVQPQESKLLLARLVHPEFTEIQEEAINGQLSPEVEKRLSWKTLEAPALEKPFQIDLKTTTIENIHVSQDLPTWALNIIRAVISPLQVDTTGENMIPSKMNSISAEENSAVFKVMEDSIDGRCEVLYNLNPLPVSTLIEEPEIVPQPQLAGNGDIIEIIKTKNYTNCEERPVYNFGLPRGSSWEAGVNNMESFMSRSGVQRMILSGSLEAHTIQFSNSVNKIVLNPTITNQQKGSLWAQTNVTLSQVLAVKEPLTLPENLQNVESLVYTYGPNTKQTLRQLSKSAASSSASSSSSSEESKQNQSSSSSSSSSESVSSEEYQQSLPSMAERNPFDYLFFGNFEKKTTPQDVEKLADKIARDLQNPSDFPKSNTADYFSILVEHVRDLSQKELEDLSDKFYSPPETTPRGFPSVKYAKWTAFRDAVAQAGTGPALLTIRSWIQAKFYILEEEAAQVVGTLVASARLPTQEYMKALFELASSQDVQQAYRLNETAILTFAELLRLAHVDRNSAHNRYPIHVYGPFYRNSEETIVKEYIPFMAAQLKKAVEQENESKIQVYIRALGKVAHPAIVPVFEPYLEGQIRLTTYQRTLIVVSMHKMSHTYPKLLRSVLYKIYSDKGEDYQVRVAAVYGLFLTRLPVSLLQSMAHSLQYEPSDQVYSAVRTAIESQANLGEFNYELRKRARAAVNLMPERPLGYGYSMVNFTDYLTSGFDASFEEDFFVIGSKDTWIPSALTYRLQRQQNGAPQRRLKAEYMMSSPSDWLDAISEILQGHLFEHQSPEKQSMMIKEIAKQLKVEKNVQEALEAAIRLDYLGAERYMTFNNQTLLQLNKNLKSLIDAMSYGTGFSRQKMYNEYEVVLAVPSVSGLPFVYTYRTPSIVAASGVVEFEDRFDPKNFVLKPKIHATYSTRNQAKLSVVAPFTKKQYVSGHDRNIHISLPIRGEIQGQYTQEGIYEVRVAFKPHDIKKQRMIHLSSWPYTSMQEIRSLTSLAEEPATQHIHVRPAGGISTIVGQESGLAFWVEAKTEKDIVQYWSLIQELIRVGPLAVFNSPVTDLGLEQTIVDIWNAPEETTTNKVEFVVSVKLSRQPGQEQQSNSIEVEPVHELPSFKSKIHRTSSHSILEEIVNKVKSNNQLTNAVAVKVALNLEARETSRYSAAFGVATDKDMEITRVYVYAEKSSPQQEDVQFYFDSVTQMPFLPLRDLSKILEASKPAQINAIASLRQGQQQPTIWTLRGILKQTEAYKNNQRQKLQQQHQLSGQHLSQAVRQASVYDKQSWTLKYENVSPMLGNISYQVLQYAYHLGFPYVAVEYIRPLEKQVVEVETQLSPNLKRINVTIETPMTVTLFENIPVHKVVRPLVAISPMHTPMEQYGELFYHNQFPATAYFEKEQIITFSNKTFPARLGNVWHALMVSQPQSKWQSGQIVPKQMEMFAVLGRQLNGKPQLKVILQNDDVIELTPAQGKVQVTVNGKTIEKSWSSQQPKVQITITPFGDVKVVFNQFEILHSGESAIVRAKQSLKSKIVGLFGRHTGEYLDLVTPQMKHIDSMENLIASFAVDAPAEIARKQQFVQQNIATVEARRYRKVVSKQDLGLVDSLGRKHRKQYYDASSGSSSSQSSSSEETSQVINALKKNSPTGCVVKRMIVVEANNKNCFSTQAQPTCEPHCRAEQTVQKTAKFACFEKNPTSEHWKQMVMRGAQPDFSKKAGQISMSYQSPIKCVQ